MRVTSRDIMEEVKIKNVKTLTRWYQAGVIPEPTIERHPNGHGTMAYWPSWVLEHCRAVKQMTDDGKTINEIAGAYGNDWLKIEAKYPPTKKRRYNFKEVSEKMDREHLLMDICDSIYKRIAKHLVSIRGHLETTTYPPVTRNVVLKVLDLVEHGHNPVLILTAERTAAVPDFIVSLHLARNQESGDLLLVIPLLPILKQFMKPTALKEPTVRPVSRIKCGETGVEHEVITSDDWSFGIKEA